MKHELHEQILIYLFELRHTSVYFDLLIKFNPAPRELIFKKIEELKIKGFIEVEYPPTGIGQFDWHSGAITFPDVEEDYLKAKITIEGIENVKGVILRKKNYIEIAHKIVTIAGVIGSLTFGLISWRQENKLEGLEELNKQLNAEKVQLTIQNQSLKTKLLQGQQSETLKIK